MTSQWRIAGYAGIALGVWLIVWGVSGLIGVWIGRG